MPKIRGNPADKWKRRTSSATEEYKLGVMNPTASWKASTMAAEANHTAGVQRAITNKSFAKGVAKSSDETWQRNAATKGADRFAGGVEAGAPNYEQGFAPYAQVINTVQLSPRGPKGDPKNYARVKEMGEALNKKKMQG